MMFGRQFGRAAKRGELVKHEVVRKRPEKVVNGGWKESKRTGDIELDWQIVGFVDNDRAWTEARLNSAARQD